MDLPRLEWETYAIDPPPETGQPCSGATNDTASFAAVRIGQTHLMEPSWPLFFAIAERPALFEVDLNGSGAAPEVRVTARRGGSEVGHVCLAGPDSLPGQGFRAVVPADWMTPDVTFQIQAGAASRTLSAEDLKIELAPSWSLLSVRVRLFGIDPEEEPPSFAQELSENWPVARLHMGRFPMVLDLPEVFIIPKGTRPPIVADHKPSAADPYNGFDVINGLRRVAKGIRLANGLVHFTSAWIHAAKLGGGVGGGGVASGSSWGGAGPHELGHAANMPHWGSASNYPYAGELGVGGGVGETAALAGWEIVPARCPDGPDAGNERQDPMQREKGGYCARPGRIMDLWSDFSGKHLYRYFRGAPKRSGQVPYRGQLVPYELSKVGPRMHWPDPSELAWVQWDAPTRQVVPLPAPSMSDRIRANYPEVLDTPVATFVGVWWSPGPSFEEGAYMYDPWLYRGNLVHHFDPTDPASFAELSQDRAYCIDGCDLTLRVQWRDGDVTHHLIRVQVEPAVQGEVATWGINVPADREMERVDLLRRRLVSDDPGKGPPGVNINDGAITPENVYDEAVVLASWIP